MSSAVGGAIENMATAVTEAFGKAVASLGTVWVNIGTPNLTGTGGTSSVAPGTAAPNAQNLTTVLSYVMWISMAVAVLSLFALGTVMATRMRAGDGVAAVGRMGLVLGSVVLISASSAMVAAVLPDRPAVRAGTVGFLQSSLWWYMGAAVVLSVILGGARMAWEQRAEPGRETVRSLLTLIVVAGAGVTVISLLVAAADSFATWIINGSLDCDVTTADGACFGENMTRLLALTPSTTTGLGSLLVIILGLTAVLASVMQIVLMVARGGMLVILAGVLPLAASATNTEMGKTWFRKCIAWLTAFVLYKPAAAIVYATAFQLTGTRVFRDDGSGLVAVLTGLLMMVLALFAMPALMRFVTPLVGTLAAGGSGGALAAAGMSTLPTGAVSLGRLASGAGSGATGGPGAIGASGANTSGPSGSSWGANGSSAGHAGAGTETAPSTRGAGGAGTSSRTGAGAAGTTGAGAGAGGATGAGSGTGAGTTNGTGPAQATGAAVVGPGAGAEGATPGGAASGAGVGGTAGAGASGATAAGASTAAGAGGATTGAGATGAAAGAGAAAGPVGIAAGAGIDAARTAGQAGASGARQATEQVTGEEEGPSGSR